MIKNILTLAFLSLCLSMTMSIEGAFAFQEPKEITLKIKENNETISNETLKNWIIYNPKLKYEKGYSSEIENTDFCDTTLVICSLLKREMDKHHTKKIEEVSANNQDIQVFLREMSKKVNKSPKNAAFSIEGARAKTFSLEENGFEIDIEKSTEKIALEIEKNSSEKIEIELPHNIIKPEVTASDVNKLGVVELIGEGKSNFSGSTRSRIHNIKVATNRFEGLLIKPGEEFSFVKILGPVDGEHGYAQEMVIKKDRTELDYGGGVCQVSTTMFRAAIYSGLEITARRNHAYPVHYYAPHGMDSTVYVPRPDLKFVNNTGKHILIQSEIDVANKQLTFRFYGTKNGRKVEVDGPHITSKNPDGSMETSFTQTVYDSKNNVVLNDTFKSSYDSPNDYPHQSQQKLTKKPDNWSDKEWKRYKKENGV